MISFGKLSPVHVHCHDKDITLRRAIKLYDETLVHVGERLLEEFFKSPTTQFSQEQVTMLKNLDNYLDIPAISAVYNRTYARLRQMVAHEYTDIPPCFFTDPQVFDQILAHDDVMLLVQLSTHRTYNEYTLTRAIESKQVSNDQKTPLNVNDNEISLNQNVSYGAINCIKWLVWECRVPIVTRYVHNVYAACRYGNVEIVQFLLDNVNDDERQNIYPRSCMEHAAGFGRLECVKFLHSKGGPIDFAIGTRYLRVVEYICSVDISKDLVERLFQYHCRQPSIEKDPLAIIKYLYARYQYWPKKCLVASIKMGLIKDSESRGLMDVFHYLINEGCAMDAEVMWTAVSYGALSYVKCLIEHKCPMDQRSTHMAAHLGRLDMLMLLHKNKCPWSPKVHSNAAKFGHFEIIKYAYEHGCAWSALTCANAAAGGYMNILTFAREHGCQWNHRTTESAARFGHLEALRYAHENGCPWNGKALYRAAKFGHVECVNYLLEHKCPFDLERALHAAKMIFGDEGDEGEKLKLRFSGK